MHKDKTSEELFDIFKSTSRQAVSDLRKRNALDLEFVARIDEAKRMLKLYKRGGVPTRQSRPREFALWKKMRYLRNMGSASIDPRFEKFEDFTVWAENQLGYAQYISSDAWTWEFHKSFLDNNCTEFSPDSCVFVPRKIVALIQRFGNTDQTSTGCCGVTYNKVNKSYVAQGFGSYLGSFTELEDAREAYNHKRRDVAKEYAEVFKESVCPKVISILLQI